MGDDLDVVSESQGTQENWNHWKIRPGTKITAITSKVNFKYSSNFFERWYELQKRKLLMHGNRK